MPSCISVFTNVDFTAVALSAPQDGFSIAVAMATPTPTPGPTGGPTATPAPSPSDTPIPTASPTETPSPSPSETPLPTPSPTSAALCISVDGSTNGFNTAQLAGPDNGFSFFNNVIVNPTPTVTPVPPTPSPTPAGGLSPGPDCANAGVWPAYGSANKYNITIADNTTEMWFQINPANGTNLYAANNTSGTRLSLTVDDGTPPTTCSSFLGPVFATYISLASGVDVAANGNGIFMIKGSNGTFPYTVDVWIDF